MRDTHAEQAVVEGVTHKCAWCGEPATSKCSRCRHVWLCGKACMKKIHKTHRRICVRTTQLVTNPSVSTLFGVGDAVWESAHRGLRGKYRVNEERWAVMQGDYDEYEEKPDYFLVLPAPARKRVLEFLDVKTLCRTEQVMTNVYALMAWFEALQGLESVALSAWRGYTSEGKFAGLRWSMNRRVRLSKVTIPKVVVPGVGEVSDTGEIFCELCVNKAWANIACMLVQSRSMTDVHTVYRLYEGFEFTPLIMAAAHNRVDVAAACIEAKAVVDKAQKDGYTPLYLASQNGHVDVARLLVDSEADIDKATKDGCTPLYIASEQGHVDVARLLVDSGADIDKAEKDGCTALKIARQQGHTAIVKLLLDAGARE